MVLFLSVNKKYVTQEQIEFKKDTEVFKDIKYLRKHFNNNNKTFRGEYYTTVNLNNVNKTNKGLFLDTDLIIDISNQTFLPIVNEKKIWKRIPNFSNYLASSDGEILTLKTGNFTKGVTAGHYLKVSIFKDSSERTKMEYVHNLVCTAFYGVKPGKNYVVMHGDDNKFNNNTKNLKWGTQSQNIIDAWKSRKSEGITMEENNVIQSMEQELSSYNNIKEYTDMLSLESNMVTQFSSFVVNKFSNLHTIFTNRIDNIINILENSKSLNISEIRKEAANIDKTIKDINFSDVDERLSPVTLGLRVTLLEVNKTLNKTTPMFEKEMMKSLTTLNDVLSNILSNEDYRISFKPKNIDSKHLYKIIHEVEENLSKLIDPNSTNDRMKVNKLIPNLSSLSNLTKETAILANKLKNNDLNKMLDLVETISEKVTMLHEYLTEKDGKFTMSKEAISALANAIDTNANLLTLHSTNYTLINQQIGMNINLIKIIR